jgi:hypothetical protein
MASALSSQFLDTVISTVVETHTSKLIGAKKNRMSEVPSLSQGTKRYEKQCVRKRVPGYLGTKVPEATGEGKTGQVWSQVDSGVNIRKFPP